MESKGNPFKKIIINSIETKPVYDGVQIDASIESKTCKSCGAPRPNKSNLATCAFCGTKFMDIDAQITSDTEKNDKR